MAHLSNDGAGLGHHRLRGAVGERGPVHRQRVQPPNGRLARSPPSNSAAGQRNRSGEDWVSRRVCANGIVCDVLAASLHRPPLRWATLRGSRRREVLRFWVGDQLVKPQRAPAPARYEPNGPYALTPSPNTQHRVSGINRHRTVNDQPALNTPHVRAIFRASPISVAGAVLAVGSR
jgi:hypothetical protein